MAEIKEVHHKLCEAALCLDYFTLFGLDRTCDTAAVNDAFRKIVRKWHPDKHAPDVRSFYDGVMARINEAHKTLSDERKRAAYLRFLESEESNVKASNEQKSSFTEAEEKYWSAVNEEYEKALKTGNMAFTVGRYGEAAIAYSEALCQLTEINKRNNYVVPDLPASLAVIIQNLNTMIESCLKQQDTKQLATVYNAAAEYLEMVANYRCYNLPREKESAAKFFFTAGDAGIKANTDAPKDSILFVDPYETALSIRRGLSDVFGDRKAAACYAAMTGELKDKPQESRDYFRKAISTLNKIKAEDTKDEDKLNLGYYTIKYCQEWLKCDPLHWEPWYDIENQYAEDTIQSLIDAATSKLGGMSDEYRKSGSDKAMMLLSLLQSFNQEVLKIINDRRQAPAEKKRIEAEGKKEAESHVVTQPQENVEEVKKSKIEEEYGKAKKKVVKHKLDEPTESVPAAAQTNDDSEDPDSNKRIRLISGT